MKKIDMVGFKTGEITVIQRSGSKNGQATWLCRCSCGKLFIQYGSPLRKGKVKSCGHIYADKSERAEIARRTIAKEKHGGSRSRLYCVWGNIRKRCNDPNCISYPNYGGRGIKVCKEWDDFSVFREWAMKNGYNPKAERGNCTIDRIDVNRDYRPDNCRWTTMTEQSNNRRNSYTITWKNETRTASEWSKITGIPRSVIYSRYKRGWDPDKILSQLKYGQHGEIVGRY